jgi:aryl-alcohol dehydrogenase-like predicted oxidoreductase
VEANLRSLELDQVPVVNLRRYDGTDVPFEDQLGTMVAMKEDGLIGGVGLSNVSLDEYVTAHSHTEIACVQNAFSVADRSAQGLFDACRDNGVAFVPFFPLGSAFSPSNPVLGADGVKATAQRLGATPAQVALAWLLALAPNVLLIPGTSSLSHLEENLAVAALELDGQAMTVLNAL